MLRLLLLLPALVYAEPDFRPYLLSTCQRIERRGQECSRRQAKTEDGYIVSLHRVHSRGLPYGPPVLLIHGLLSASDQWLLYGRDHDLASILADKGYDVWLGDLRGNAYSRSHTHLSPEDPDFWDFSFHEYGYYDVPAMIDYIRLETGHKKIFYIGYSLGGTVFFVMGASRPEYNNKIRAGITIAPYVSSPQLSSVILATFSMIASIMRQWRTLHVFEVFPRSNTTLAINQIFCKPKSRLLPVCLQVYDQVFGLTSELDQDVLLDVVSTFRAGSSAKTLNHCAQVMYANSLRYYDYESEENMKRYGDIIPPEYNLTKVTSPVSIHYSLQDSFVDPKVIDKLAKKLPKLIGTFVVSSPSFNHMDYVVGIHARELVYQDIFNIISKY
ncbi:unnamed protein product [Nezara viridula]|uniref:Lipase n=1 Tax=Nezara viridula TaxID=85310 RepID=A0A9P0E2H6_NEZVI|nr:unnamed protein product [Nezara viridula]